MPLRMTIPLPGPFSYSTRLSGRGGGGCLGVLGVLVFLGVIVQYWVAALAVGGIVVTVGVVYYLTRPSKSVAPPPTPEPIPPVVVTRMPAPRPEYADPRPARPVRRPHPQIQPVNYQRPGRRRRPDE